MPAPRPRKKPQQSSLITTLQAVGQLLLVVIGLVGLSVETFRDQGWLSRLFNGLIDSRLGLASIPLVVIVVFIVNRIMVARDRGGEHTKRGDIPLYLMMAIGVFFLFNLLTTGSF